MRRKDLMLAALTLTGTALASAPPSLSESDRIRNVDSCYRGIFSDVDTYVAHIETLDSPDPEASIQAAIERYAYWKNNIDCYWYDYTVDGITVKGFVARPVNTKNDKTQHPVVIFNRGGNADTGGIPDRYLFDKVFPYVVEGYVLVGSQYRGAELNGQRSPDRLKDEFGGAYVNDVLALVPIIEDFDFADRNRIGLWGLSRGAMISFIAARQSDRFSALLAEYGPTDLELGLNNRPGMADVFNTWIPEFGTEQQQQALRNRSVVHWADELPDSMPVLLLHGEQDRRVNVEHAHKLAEELERLDHPYQLVLYPEGHHGLRRQWRETKAEFVRFFGEHLGTDVSDVAQ